MVQGSVDGQHKGRNQTDLSSDSVTLGEWSQLSHPNFSKLHTIEAENARNPGHLSIQLVRGQRTLSVKDKRVHISALQNIWSLYSDFCHYNVT